ncbi:hypothetical protein [Pediococcus stilesii]|nr:hypothetical protein [Pediococcus stilesii]
MGREVIRFLVFIFGLTVMAYFSQYRAKAAINRIGLGNYAVDTGSDLFDLLSNSNGYWNRQGNTPENITINVTKDITLPRTQPNIYPKIKNVNVNFQGHEFFVDNQNGSAIIIPPTSTVQVMISNLNTIYTYGTNWYFSAPPSSNRGNFGAYVATRMGLLFSSDSSETKSVISSNAQITYNNVTYIVPRDYRVNQPLSSYYIPINFIGNNHIENGVSGRALGGSVQHQS